MSGWLLGAGTGNGLGRVGGCPSLNRVAVRASIALVGNGPPTRLPAHGRAAGAGGEAVPEGPAPDRDRGTLVPGRDNCGGGQDTLPRRAAVAAGVARVDRDHREALGVGHRDDPVLELGGREPGDEVAEILASPALLPGLRSVKSRSSTATAVAPVAFACSSTTVTAARSRPSRVAAPAPVSASGTRSGLPTGLPEVSRRVAARWSAFRSTPTTPPARAAARSTGIGVGRTQETRR